MPYSQRFVVSVLVNGQVQEERPDGSVTIPFGVEYAFRFRNKHRDRRAVVKLFIDGEEQSKGGYVIPPNGSKVIERNSHSPKRFKFVAPTSVDAQDFGKDQENVEGYNGVIDARFYLEKEQPKEIHHHHHHHDHYIPRPRPWPYPRPWDDRGGVRPLSFGGVECSANSIKATGGPSGQSVGSNASAAAPLYDDAEPESVSMDPESVSMDFEGAGAAPTQHVNSLQRVAKQTTVAGVTVEGSHSHQTFRAVDIDLEEQFVAIKVLLRGFQGETYEEVEVVDDEREIAEKKK